MDTAVFWIEYVVRNGPNVMRSPALDFTWWQLGLLDVYGSIILVFILTKCLFYYVFRYAMQKLLLLLIVKDMQDEKKVK